MPDTKSRAFALLDEARRIMAEAESDAPSPSEAAEASIPGALVTRLGCTLQDVVREDIIGDLSRLMLRIWLNHNLPNLVASEVHAAVAEAISRRLSVPDPDASFAQMVVSVITRNRN